MHTLIRTLGLLLFFPVLVNAQTGVNTLTPAVPLKIVTSGETVIVDDLGKVGVGVASPVTGLDLRAGANQAMALGMTNQSAVDAGAGAIRYNPSPAIGVQGYLEFSDGTQWVPYFPYGKPRIVVIAEKNNSRGHAFETGAAPIGTYDRLPQRTATYLIDWTEKLDSDSGTPASNFDPATGEFIAPRSGVYFASFTFCLAPNVINNNDGNQVEAIWEVRNSGGTITQRVKTNNGFPNDTGGSEGSAQAMAGSACTVSVHLNEGDRLRPFVWFSVSFSNPNTSNWNGFRLLQTTGGYNVLTIVEQ